jgi:putative membrane protein
MATRMRRLLDGRRPDDTFRLAALDGTLAELTNLLGGCERIMNSPIARQYDTAVLAAFVLGPDQIGRDVETPFEDGIHDTPMTALCRTIEINLRQMLGETELPPPVQPVRGILH